MLFSFITSTFVKLKILIGSFAIKLMTKVVISLFRISYIKIKKHKIHMAGNFFDPENYVSYKDQTNYLTNNTLSLQVKLELN